MNSISLIILAAGFSKRFGNTDKLLAKIENSSILATTLSVYEPNLFERRILVVNSDNGEIAAIGRNAGFEITKNDDADSGIGTSIAKGVEECTNSPGVMIGLGDMPFLKQEIISLLIHDFNRSERRNIIAPYFGNQRGHPVVFPNRCFSALKTLDNDNGGASVIEKFDQLLRPLLVECAGVIDDVDGPEDLPPLIC